MSAFNMVLWGGVNIDEHGGKIISNLAKLDRVAAGFM